MDFRKSSGFDNHGYDYTILWAQNKIRYPEPDNDEHIQKILPFLG